MARADESADHSGRHSNGHQADLGRLIRARRLTLGLTQQELAQLAEVSVGALRDFEQGRTSQPRPRLVTQLTRAVGLDAAQVVAGTAGAAAPRAGGRTSGDREGLRLQVLGPMAGWRDGTPLRLGEPRQRAVLGLLALNAGTRVHRDALVDALWGDGPPASAVNLVQSYVGRLRRVLDAGRSPRDPAGVLLSARTSYLLQVDTDQLDWLAFRHQVRRAGVACSSGDAGSGCEWYERALKLWRGKPLMDVEILRDQPAVQMVMHSWAAAVRGYAQASIDVGTPERVIPYLLELTERDRFHEGAHALLMMALAAAGQQAAALRVFDDIRERLATHLGIAPGEELRDTQLRVLRQDIPTNAPRREPGTRGFTVARQLPAGVRHFAGRTDQLKALTGLIEGIGESESPGAAVVILAIGGTAGIGKTTLALHWANTVADRFPDGQLYVDLRGFDPVGPPVGATEAIRGFLDALGVPAERIPTGVDAQAALYRSLLAGRRVLVVLDNARSSTQVRPLLPGSPTCTVVVTSRSRLTSLVAIEGAHCMTVDLLDAAEAGELLARRLGTARVTAEPRAVEDLIELCAGLPLALSLAAARAATHPDFPLAALVDQLRGARSRMDALSAGEPAGDLRAVFASSYHQLGPASAHLFRLLGLHPGPVISLPAAASLAGVSLEEAGRCLDELTGAHLLTERVPGRYGVHDLLRRYAAELAGTADTDTERQAAIRRMLDHYLHTAVAGALILEPHRGSIGLAVPAPGVVPETVTDRAGAADWFTAEHAVLLTCVRYAAEVGCDAQAVLLAWALATFLCWRGHWHDLVATQQIAVHAAQRAGDRSAQAVAHRLLGRGHTRLGRLGKARVQFSRALELFGELGDRDGQARVHHDLASVYERQKRNREALAHAERAFQLHSATAHKIWQARALNAVGWYSALLGDFARALTCCGQALALHQRFGDAAGEAHTWDSLGYAHHHLGDHAEAAACYQRALDLHLGFGDRYHEAQTLIRLGDAHDAAGDTQAAHRARRHALNILTELGHAGTDGVPATLRDSPTGATATGAGSPYPRGGRGR